MARIMRSKVARLKAELAEAALFAENLILMDRLLAGCVPGGVAESRSKSADETIEMVPHTGAAGAAGGYGATFGFFSIRRRRCAAHP